jgi:hypothetical protein
MESLVSDILAGDKKIANLFYSVKLLLPRDSVCARMALPRNYLPPPPTFCHWLISAMNLFDFAIFVYLPHSG